MAEKLITLDNLSRFKTKFKNNLEIPLTQAEYDALTEA